MKLLMESTRSMSLLVLFNMDRFLVPLLIIAALFLAGALFDYATSSRPACALIAPLRGR